MAVTSSGRTLSGGFDPAALYPAKIPGCSSRNCEEGGSLTIIGTLWLTLNLEWTTWFMKNSREPVIMELHLDRSYAEKRIYPAIDIERSGTSSWWWLLLTPERMDKIATLRRRMGLLSDKDERIQGFLVENSRKRRSNEAFLEEIASSSEVTQL